uniref:Peroxisomal membrane protein 2 n=1 Tax=Aotus nancymaae TaxID=37293 RepID=A0A2K5BYA9_AOTNA
GPAASSVVGQAGLGRGTKVTGRGLRRESRRRPGLAFFVALGNFLAQMIEKKRKKENSRSLDVSGPLRYCCLIVGEFFFTGPLSHFFRLFMEHRVPPEVPLDRRLFAPAFLMLFFRAMNVWRWVSAAALPLKWREGRGPPLFISWFRVLFANLVALFLYAYLASLGK